MKITDVLPKRGIKVGMEARDKSSAIKELVDILGRVKDIGDKRALVKALVDREKLGSTGIGQGIAIPHAKSDKVNELIAVLGISKKGVDFEALDGEQVYLFCVPLSETDDGYAKWTVHVVWWSHIILLVGVWWTYDLLFPASTPRHLITP